MAQGTSQRYVFDRDAIDIERERERESEENAIMQRTVFFFLFKEFNLDLSCLLK